MGWLGFYCITSPNKFVIQSPTDTYQCAVNLLPAQLINTVFNFTISAKIRLFPSNAQCHAKGYYIPCHYVDKAANHFCLLCEWYHFDNSRYLHFHSVMKDQSVLEWQLMLLAWSLTIGVRWTQRNLAWRQFFRTIRSTFGTFLTTLTSPKIE